MLFVLRVATVVVVAVAVTTRQAILMAVVLLILSPSPSLVLKNKPEGKKMGAWLAKCCR